MKLTAKQQAFIREYLVDFNATQAAIRAGYSKKTAQVISTENLSKPIIQEAIQKEIKKRNDRIEVTQEMVINELAKIAFSNMGKLAQWTASGVSFIPSEDLTADEIATVAEVSETTTMTGGSLKIKQYDKIKALDLLGKHLGMFTQKVEVTGKDGQPININTIDAGDVRSRLLSVAANSETAEDTEPV
jgi:phage terminase small subunit